LIFTSLLQLFLPLKKSVCIICFLFCCAQVALAQDFTYGDVSRDELEMKSYPKDISAHAVVLQEFGNAKIAVVTGEDIRMVFEYHVKIKILDNKGFEKGTVTIPAYHNSDNPGEFENVDDIAGITYYNDDNGAGQKIELEGSKIYPEKVNKHLLNYKFTMPGMRNGCVIEFKYRITSPYLFNFPTWRFQDDIPKIYSDYEIHIPAYWRYNFSLKGGLKLTKSSATVERSCFTINGGDGLSAAAVDCSLLDYAMRDVPAFVEEDYTTSPKNFMSSVSSTLIEHIDPYNGRATKQTREWKDVDVLLKQDIVFGDQLKKKTLFKDRIVPVIADKTDDLSKAKAVYEYTRRTIKWDGNTDMESSYSLSNALNKHTGNTADVNLSLVVALQAAGLNAAPVLLSTREHGTVNSLYPVVADFNYVIARVDIGGQTYLLDATDPLLPFGMLPLKCLNGKGRTFSLDKPSEWIDINPAQKAKSTRTLDLTLQETGKLTGTYIRYSSGYDAYEKRLAIKKFNTIDEYISDFNSRYPKIKVLKAEVNNLDSLENPLIEKYEVEIDATTEMNKKSLAFNPFFWDKIDVNPFKQTERSFPVDLGWALDQRYNLTIHLPDQYTIDTPPQPVGIGIPDGGGQFVTNYQAADNSFKFSNVIQLNKPVYAPEEYAYLKEFYNKIVQSEKAEVIFKKK